MKKNVFAGALCAGAALAFCAGQVGLLGDSPLRLGLLVLLLSGGLIYSLCCRILTGVFISVSLGLFFFQSQLGLPQLSFWAMLAVPCLLGGGCHLLRHAPHENNAYEEEEKRQLA